MLYSITPMVMAMILCFITVADPIETKYTPDQAYMVGGIIVGLVSSGVITVMKVLESKGWEF